MKLKMMLMRIDRRTLRGSAGPLSESGTDYRGQAIFNSNTTIAPEYAVQHLNGNHRTEICSGNPSPIGPYPPSCCDIHTPFMGAFSPSLGDNHTHLIGAWDNLLGSSRLHGGPLTTHKASNAMYFNIHGNGNPMSNTDIQTDVKKNVIPNRTYGVFAHVRCQWEGCTMMIRSDMIRHLHLAHLADYTDGYMCRWKNCCRRGKLFTNRYKLISHVRTHDNRVFHCVLCSKGFSKKEALKIHLRCHTGERPYQCSFAGCKKKFKSPSDRCKHFKTHQERHPYKCHVFGCNKKYTDPSTCRKHEKKHLRDSGKIKISKSKLQ